MHTLRHPSIYNACEHALCSSYALFVSNVFTPSHCTPL